MISDFQKRLCENTEILIYSFRVYRSFVDKLSCTVCPMLLYMMNKYLLTFILFLIKYKSPVEQ